MRWRSGRRSGIADDARFDRARVDLWALMGTEQEQRSEADDRQLDGHGNQKLKPKLISGEANERRARHYAVISSSPNCTEQAKLWRAFGIRFWRNARAKAPRTSAKTATMQIGMT